MFYTFWLKFSVSCLCEAREINELKIWILGWVEVKKNLLITHILGVLHSVTCSQLNLFDDLSKIRDFLFRILVTLLLNKNSKILNLQVLRIHSCKQCCGSGSVESVLFPWLRIHIKSWAGYWSLSNCRDPDPTKTIENRK